VVAAEASGSLSKPRKRKLSDRQKLALEALSNCAADRGTAPPASLGLPAGISAIWRDELVSTGIIERDRPNSREAFADATKLRRSCDMRRDARDARSGLSTTGPDWGRAC
jgi:hypothetical protein